MAKGKFGERLKRERELREVSLDELSKATRISNRFLQALENEDWEKLPGGVFGHGFVRSIARYLGLGEEALLGEYDLARSQKVPLPPSKPDEPIPSPPKWIPAAALVALLLITIGLFFVARYAWHRIASHRAPKQSSKQHFDVRASNSSAVLLELNGPLTAPLGVPGTLGRMVSRARFEVATGGDS